MWRPFRGRRIFAPSMVTSNTACRSADWLSIVACPGPEEFPDFIAYYLERPAVDSNRVTVYGLLDSPSVAGAYRFVIDVADTIVMDIDAALYPRTTIERLGIAPGTSMFLDGPNDRRVDNDWRPAIHDSDGLQIYNGNGEWLWRPLVNPSTVRVNSFVDESPHGFGLMQRDRDFDHYQDDGVFYDLRPSVWVEPKGSWGKGAVMLVELPTSDETFDNIVAFWTPADKPQRGQELLYGYRLYWCRYNPQSCPLAQVHATRSGIGGVVGQKRTYFSWRFVVDFAGGRFPLLAEDAHIEPMISASRGQIEITSARPLHSINGWRAMFDLKPTDDSTRADQSAAVSGTEWPAVDGDLDLPVHPAAAGAAQAVEPAPGTRAAGALRLERACWATVVRNCGSGRHRIRCT